MKRSMVVSSQSGALELEAVDAGYELERSTLEGARTCWRHPDTHQSESVGTRPVGRPREEVPGIVAVRVTGASSGELKMRVSALVDALSQRQYLITFREDNDVSTWVCQAAAGCQIRYGPALSRTAVISTEVPRSALSERAPTRSEVSDESLHSLG